ncbi:uncharacterized protein LOC119075721 isoform X2 [Bradysia coprophila]|uniref:uncharacterized protein LOC119075721 isoform X2 n=1 Tax=Bradysia coprophila TaxID=38358 RepID=UPI00187DD3D2|nr:uncharacterized protein LOC119075721 isoform X2 [Bradysia coprophila]
MNTVLALYVWTDVTYIEEDLPQWMSETQKLYRNKSKDSMLESAPNQLLIEKSSAAANLLTKMLKSLPKNTNSNTARSLANCIDNEVDRRIFWKKMKSMKSAVEIVIERFETVTTGETVDAATVVNEIGIELGEIIVGFTAASSTFRHYPELLADTFLTLATVYNQFYPIFWTSNQSSNANVTKLPCLIASALENYRDFYTVWRMSRMQPEYLDYGRTIYPGLKCTAQIIHFDEVVQERFNRNGYSTDWSRFCWATDGYECSINCKQCVEDFLDDKHYETNCFREFLQHIRHKIEQFFQPSIDTARELCEKFHRKYFLQPKYPTGFGWLFIRTQFFLISGNRWYSHKNPYALIEVNETEVLRTPTVPECSSRFIDGTYTTGRIGKNTRIGMTLFEQKTNGDNSLLLRQSLAVEGLFESKNSHHFLCGSTIWRDDFSTDPQFGTTVSAVSSGTDPSTDVDQV